MDPNSDISSTRLIGSAPAIRAQSFGQARSHSSRTRRPQTTYNTPLPPRDPDVRVDRSDVPALKQESRDARRSKRLHDAFTRGFNAGYYNTLGSKEGQTPSTRVSSRSNRKKDEAKPALQQPEDFMDVRNQNSDLVFARNKPRKQEGEYAMARQNGPRYERLGGASPSVSESDSEEAGSGLDDDNSSEFSKMLDSKKTLQSFQLDKVAQTFQKMAGKAFKLSSTFAAISSTISRDNTCGESARRAKLFAEFAGRGRPCILIGNEAKVQDIYDKAKHDFGTESANDVVLSPKPDFWQRVCKCYNLYKYDLNQCPRCGASNPNPVLRDFDKTQRNRRFKRDNRVREREKLRE